MESPGAVPEFTDKLMRTGYLDADTEVYSTSRTVLHDMLGFSVNGDFPLLTAASVPPGITDVSYALDERQLVPFRLPHEELRRQMREMSNLPHD